MVVKMKRPLRLLLIGLLVLAIALQSHPAIAQLTPTEQFHQGQQAYRNSQYTQAADLWQAAAEGFATAEAPLQQAMAQSNRGLAYLKLGRYNEAATAIATARELIQTLSESPQQQQVSAQILSAQGQLQQAQGQSLEAIQSFIQAEASYATADDVAGVLRSQLNQAQILRLQGQQRQAYRRLNQVAEQLKTLPDSVLKANGLRQLGNALRFVETVDETKLLVGDAETVLQTSLAVARAIDAPNEQSATLISLGNTAEAGQVKESTDAAQQSLALAYYTDAAAIAIDPTLRLQAQVNRLRLLQSGDQQSEAKFQLAEILHSIETLPPGRRGLFVRVNLADFLISHRPLVSDRAIADLLAETLQQAQALSDELIHSYALGYLGKLYQSNSQWLEATDLTRQALRLSQSLNAHSVTYRWQWQLGQLLVAQGDIETAINTYQETLETLERLRSDLAAINPEVRFSFREGIEPIYRELVSLLLESDETVPIPQANLLQARDVIESLQVAELVNFFRADCVVTTPVELEQVDTNALVIYPIILPDRLEVVVSAPGQPLQRVRIPVAEAMLNQTLDDLRQAISQRPSSNGDRNARAIIEPLLRTPELSDPLPLAQQAYDWLIRPIETQIQVANPDVLVFVLDGSLRNVPMGVLHDGEQYLIEKHAIALTPGLQLLEPQPLATQQLQALVAGLSEARDDFGDLPNVEREVTAIQTQVSGAVLLNEDFSKENFAALLTDSSFPIVHLATHGQFSSDPEQTFILAWDERIRATELGSLLQQGELRRDAAVELLVLSACETATGDERAALGLAGVAVRSGARSTLATLWLVDDQGTSVLMEDLYRELKDTSQTKAEVLRQAQLQLLHNEEYNHPYFWAPFILIGNWL